MTGNGVDEGHIRIPSPDAPSFVAVNKKTGKVIWKDNSPGKNIMHGQWGNPSFAAAGGRPQVIFPGGDGWLYAFDPPTGRTDLEIRRQSEDRQIRVGQRRLEERFRSAARRFATIVSTSAPARTQSISQASAHLWCIDLKCAVRLGQTNPNHDVSPVNDNLDPRSPVNATSALAWHFGGPEPLSKGGRDFSFGRTLSTCAIHDGLCYAAELDGHLHCLDAKTGKRYWSHDCRAQSGVRPCGPTARFTSAPRTAMCSCSHGEDEETADENRNGTSRFGHRSLPPTACST